MKNLLIGFLAIILVSLSAQAQNGSNNSRETVEDTEHGYSFTAPANWSIQKSEGKCAGVLLENSAKTINIVVKPHHSANLADFFKNESNVAGEGFRQVGEVRELANNMKYVRVYKSINSSGVFLDIIFIPFSGKTGAVVMNFTPTERLAEDAMTETVDIVKSFRYSAPASTEQSEPETSSSASPGSSNSAFASKRFYAESGSSQTEIILCPSGGYRKNSNFFFSGGTSTDLENGSWRVQGNTLILVSAKGEQTTYQVGSQSGNYIMLNNRRYSMSNYSCR